MGKITDDVAVRVELEHKLAAVRYSSDQEWQVIVWGSDRDVAYFSLDEWPRIAAAVERVIAEHKRVQEAAETMTREALAESKQL